MQPPHLGVIAQLGHVGTAGDRAQRPGTSARARDHVVDALALDEPPDGTSAVQLASAAAVGPSGWKWSTSTPQGTTLTSGRRHPHPHQLEHLVGARSR